MMPIARRPVAERLRRWFIAKCAPISIDGQTVEAITIDGEDVTEVTMDGDTVFEDSAIPDSAMFQSPIYQFYSGEAGYSDGQSPVDFPEILDENQSAASATNTPTFRSDYQSTGKDMIEFNSSNPDYHTATLGSNFSDDDNVSVFASYYTGPVSNRQLVFSSGGSGGWGVGVESSAYAFINDSDASFSGGNAQTNQIDTVGVTLEPDNDSSDNIILYGGGSQQAASDSPFNLDTSIELGNWTTFSARFNGGIFDIVITDATESLSAYQSYHNDRTA